jgi:hypothetical protein
MNAAAAGNESAHRARRACDSRANIIRPGRWRRQIWAMLLPLKAAEMRHLAHSTGCSKRPLTPVDLSCSVLRTETTTWMRLLAAQQIVQPRVPRSHRNTQFPARAGVLRKVLVPIYSNSNDYQLRCLCQRLCNRALRGRKFTYGHAALPRLLQPVHMPLSSAGTLKVRCPGMCGWSVHVAGLTLECERLA